MLFEADYEIRGPLTNLSSKTRLFKCQKRGTSELCFAKVYNKDVFSERRIALSCQEGRIGVTIPRHPNISAVCDYYDEPTRVVVVSTWMTGGSLYKELAEKGRMPDPRAAELLADILSGLAHLHGQGIMHRDIKPENLLFPGPLGETGLSCNLCVADFGFATTTIPNDQCVGSPQYCAPELALIGLQHHKTTHSKPLYNEKCDVWSVGVVACVMLTALLPFDGATPTDVFQRVVERRMPTDLPQYQRLSPGAKSFIADLTNTNPSKRPSAKEALRHPWIAQYRKP